MSDALYQNYKDGKLDEQVRSFLIELSKNESTPLQLQKPEEIRRNSSIINWVQERGKAFRVDNISIAGKGSNIPIRIYSPRGKGPYPVLVYFHGGGWVFGTLDEADHICNAFSNEIPAIVVSVDYRLSPEYKCPIAIEDGYDALLWTEKTIRNHKGNANYIAVVGESAGANIATVISQISRDKKGPKIAYQLLICPVTNLTSFDSDSYTKFGNGIWLSKKNMEYYTDQYLQNRIQAGDPYISPLLTYNLKNLPSAHIITAEFDVLRDDGEEYAKRLSEAGNVVTHKRYSGMIHSFIILNKVINRANDAIDDCISLLQTNLQHE
jgi:acetyl esterase